MVFIIAIAFLMKPHIAGIGERLSSKFSEGPSGTMATTPTKGKQAEKNNEGDRWFNLGNRKRESSLRLVAVGDVMFHNPQLQGAYNKEGDRYDFSPYFEAIKPIVQEADLAFANYETTMADGIKPISTYPQFNSPVETLELLRDSGFDVLATANNHCLDTGKTGIVSTIDGIVAHEMDYIGTQKDAEGKRVLYKEINDIKIAILAYTYGFNGLEGSLSGEDRKVMLHPIEEEQMQVDISEAMNSEADLIVSYIHWGEEYSTTPSQFQQDLADKMLHWGVDIIFGSHPHVLQRAEEREINGEKKFIIYSMGNFISNQRVETLNNKHTESGVMVAVKVTKDSGKKTTLIEEVKLIPTWVYRSPEKPYQYKVIPSKEYLEKEELLQTLDEASQKRLRDSYETSLKILQ